MGRTLGWMTAALLLVSAGCATSGGGTGTGGNGDGLPGENDNVNTNGGGPSGQNDNAGNDNAGNDNAGNDNAGNDNAPDDSGELPTAFRLDGVWDDGGSNVIIEQNGTAVVGNYFSEFICDLDSGPVPANEQPEPGASTQSTFLDFQGTLNNGAEVLPGDMIIGETSVCNYGRDSGNGLALAALTLTVVDENTLSGEWELDRDGDGQPDASGSITVTRLQ